MQITESDKNKIVLLKDGSYAKIVSVIKEIDGISLIMGKIKDNSFIFWNSVGEGDSPEKNIERVLKTNG